MMLKFNGTFIALSSTAIYENPKENNDVQVISFYKKRENLQVKQNTVRFGGDLMAFVCLFSLKKPQKPKPQN